MKKTIGTFIVCIAIWFPSSRSNGAVNKIAVAKVGDVAPTFEGIDDQGQVWKSADHVGKKILVVYFCPSNATSKAGKQARGYQDTMNHLAEDPVELVGVSGDSVQVHQAFKEKNQLNYTLLSDEEGALAKSFGVSVRNGGGNRKVTIAARTFVIGLDGKIVFSRSRITSLSDADLLLDLMVKDFWSNREDQQAVWMPKTPREWMRVLSREQYRVTRHKRTEKAHSGKYVKTHEPGNYRCVCCGQVVFASTTKFDSRTGWPSFWNPASQESVKLSLDKGPMNRVEVQCTRCDAHLGHVFPDGPQPTGHRYCINSASIVFKNKPTQPRP